MNELTMSVRGPFRLHTARTGIDLHLVREDPPDDLVGPGEIRADGLLIGTFGYSWSKAPGESGSLVLRMQLIDGWIEVSGR